jgi:signal transduction histidine kinase
VLRRRGELTSAADQYAMLSAAPIVALLRDLALVEMHGSEKEKLKAAREFATGEPDLLDDVLADAAAERLLAGVSEEARASPEAAETRRRLEFRRGARRPARQLDGARLASHLEAQSARAPDALVMALLGTGPETGLLALGRATSERAPLRPERGRARPVAWIGVRFDLPALVNDILDDYLTRGDKGFYIVVRDAAGTPLLASRSADPGETVAPDYPTVANLFLHAVPVDSRAFIEGRRATIRNGVVLLLGLGALALGGAFFLARSASREAELSALKVDFVSRVSHELKTPLALIRMYGETLARGRAKDAEQTSHFGGIVAREADRLTHMIERILDFSRQGAGTLSYRKELLDLGDLAAGVVENYRPHLAQHGCQVAVDLAEGLEVEVDRDAMARTLVNLVENAAKYTPRDRAERTIEVGLTRDDGHAVLEVRDRGVGVPRDEATKIFDPFYRGSNVGEVRGAGLGLSLVQHFVRAHDGTVEALQRAGGGTTLRLRLPLAGDGASPAFPDAPDS